MAHGTSQITSSLSAFVSSMEFSILAPARSILFDDFSRQVIIVLFDSIDSPQSSTQRNVNPFTTGNPFSGTKLLGFSIGRGSGALKGLTFSFLHCYLEL